MRPHAALTEPFREKCPVCSLLLPCEHLHLTDWWIAGFEDDLLNEFRDCYRLIDKKEPDPFMAWRKRLGLLKLFSKLIVRRPLENELEKLREAFNQTKEEYADIVRHK